MFCIQTIVWCCSQVPVIPFTLENPIRSILWLLPPMKKVIRQFKLVLLQTHMCMLGSDRRKESGILTNRPDIFSNLVKRCDGKHEHKPWGAAWDSVTGRWVFATGQECEYPDQFCDCLAQCLADHYGTEPRIAPKARSKRPKPRQNKLRTRAQVGHQSKRLRSMCFVPDRKSPEEISWWAEAPEDVRQGKISYKTKLGGVTLDKGDVIRETAFEKNGSGSGVTMSAKIERVRTPTEFIEKALELEVPWKGQPNIPDHSLQSIVETLERSLKDTSSRWTEQIELLARRVTKLRGEEQGARKHLHPSVSKVTAGKSTVAMKELLEELGYPDSSVCDSHQGRIQVSGRL